MAARKRPDEAQTVASAVERDLADIAKRDKRLAGSALAMSALRLAREMDSSENSATSKSMCAKGLQEALRELRDLAPAERQEDEIDQIAKQREKRRARSTKATA